MIDDGILIKYLNEETILVSIKSFIGQTWRDLNV
jgi:hypothetical protein